ncbi:hypothetical protein D030_5035A, partial [Vibrio parahaemolyticus AQ3810]
MGRQHC